MYYILFCVCYEYSRAPSNIPSHVSPHALCPSWLMVTMMHTPTLEARDWRWQAAKVLTPKCPLKEGLSTDVNTHSGPLCRNKISCPLRDYILGIYQLPWLKRIYIFIYILTIISHIWWHHALKLWIEPVHSDVLPSGGALTKSEQVTGPLYKFCPTKCWLQYHL